MTDNMDTTETLKRTAWTETERVGPLKRFGFPREGEGLGEGATQCPKIYNNFFI